MKNSRDGGFSQQYNAQAAVEQDALLIVGCSLSRHANDQREGAPTLATIPPAIGKPSAAALDTGYFRETNLKILEDAGIAPSMATGRDPHHAGWTPALPTPVSLRRKTPVPVRRWRINYELPPGKRFIVIATARWNRCSV